jgi:hypothetical protein
MICPFSGAFSEKYGSVSSPAKTELPVWIEFFKYIQTGFF